MSGVVYRPPGVHVCRPGSVEEPCAPDGPLAGYVSVSLPFPSDFPPGTVWECDCGTRWISRGLVGGGRDPRGGYSPAVLGWKREGRFARWRRLRKDRARG